MYRNYVAYILVHTNCLEIMQKKKVDLQADLCWRVLILEIIHLQNVASISFAFLILFGLSLSAGNQLCLEVYYILLSLYIRIYVNTRLTFVCQYKLNQKGLQSYYTLNTKICKHRFGIQFCNNTSSMEYFVKRGE